jgi:hypothetical protein
VRGVGVDHHHVGGQSLAVGQHHPRRPAALDEHLRDGRPEPHDGTAQHRPLVHCCPEPAQPAGHVPGAERLLDVRHDRQRGGRAARVGAGVGGVAVEEHPQPRVAQVLLAEPAQRLPRRHRAHVAGPPGQPQQVPAAGQRRLEERHPGHLPDVVRAVEEAVPVRAGTGAEGVVERHPQPARDAFGRSSQVTSWPSTAGTGSAPPGRPPQVEAFLERLPGLHEQVPVDGRQRQQRGTGVEDEPVTLEGAELAAPGRRLLADDDVVTEGGQAGRDGEAGHPCPHHHDPRHVVTLRKSCVGRFNAIRGVELVVCPSRPTT